jgi:hypothetical protein
MKKSGPVNPDDLWLKYGPFTWLPYLIDLEINRKAGSLLTLPLIVRDGSVLDYKLIPLSNVIYREQASIYCNLHLRVFPGNP